MFTLGHPLGTIVRISDPIMYASMLLILAFVVLPTFFSPNFPAALATSSAAFAFTLGRPDMGHVTREEALKHAEDLVRATDLPVSGDFENGFADDPDGVAKTIRLAAEAGLSG